MKLSFNHDSLKTINQRDLMNFVSYVLQQEYIKTAERVYVNTSSLETVNDLNCRVIIKFQTWNEQQAGYGTVRYWICKRANDFCCSQQYCQTFPPMPIEK